MMEVQEKTGQLIYDGERRRKVFAVDGGFGFVKWLWGGGKGKVRSCYKRHGDVWLIGEKALLESGSRYLRTVDELVDMYPVFVSYCEEKAGIKDFEKDVIVVGLPHSAWVNDEENGGIYLEKLSNSLKKLGYKDVFLFPQGLGGIKWFLKQRPDVGGNILAVDVGFNTVIVVLYSVDEKEILLSETYYKKGMYDLTVSILLPKIKRLIKQDRTLTPAELNYLMEHKKFQVGFDAIDVTSEVEESVQEYVEDLISFILNDIKSRFGVVTFNYVLFIGGGANYLRDKISAKKVEIVIPDEPEFANVFGFREKAYELLGG